MNKLWILLVGLLFFSGCIGLNDPAVGVGPGQHNGGTSEQGNAKVIGKLAYENGQAAESVQVYMRPRGFLPLSSSTNAGGAFRSTLTDSLGAFVIDSLDSGLYVLEAQDASPKGLFIDSVRIPPGITPMTVFSDTLRPLGEICGSVRIPRNVRPQEIAVFAYGIDQVVRPDLNGNFSFSGLAQGKYSLKLSAEGLTSKEIDTSNIPVKAGDTTRVGRLSFFMLQLDFPNGGETLRADSTYIVRWRSDIPGHVNLFYSPDSVHWIWINENDSIRASQGYCLWTIKPVQTTYSHATIKIVEATAAYPLADMNDAAFTLVPYQPDPYESNDSMGAAHRIQVPSTLSQAFIETGDDEDFFVFGAGAPSRIRISLTGEAEASMYLFDPTRRLMAICGNNESITVNAAMGDHYLQIQSIRAGNRYAVDLDTLPSIHFTLVSPGSGEIWVAESTYTVSWTTNAESEADLYLSLNGSEYSLIGSARGEKGSFDWTLPTFNAPMNSARVKIQEKAVSPAFAFSKPFSIQQNRPDPYEENNSFQSACSLQAGDTIQNAYIAWGQDRDFFMFAAKQGQRIGIGFFAETQSSAFLTLFNGHFQYMSCANPQETLYLNTPEDGDYYLLFQGPSDGMRYNFWIRERDSISLTLVSPPGWNIVETESLCAIAWSTNLKGDLKLYYSLNIPDEFRLIASVDASLGVFAWKVPLVHSNISGAKIKICETFNAVSPKYILSNPFSIRQGSPDPFERNDSFSSAFRISAGDSVQGAFIAAEKTRAAGDTIQALTNARLDEDYFVFSAVEGHRYHILFQALSPQISMILYDSAFRYLANGSQMALNAAKNGDYYIRISTSAWCDGIRYNLQIKEVSQ